MTPLMGTNSSQPRRFSPVACALLAVALLATAARAEVRFDVFYGFGVGTGDGVVREAAWFPVICEVQNDGPAFNAVIELIGGSYGQGQTRITRVELPTGSLKRIQIPIYATGRMGYSLDARLLDEKRHVRGERLGLRPRVQTTWDSPVLGSLPRTREGRPLLPEIKAGNNQIQPAAIQIKTEWLPDNPLTLEGLDALYLHSAEALRLSAGQAAAVLAWVHNGGHLIVGVEQAGEINNAPWLKNFLPCELSGESSSRNPGAIHEWLTTASSASEWDDNLRTTPVPKPRVRAGQPAPATPAVTGNRANPYANLATDARFAADQMPVASARLRDGRVLMGSTTAPLAMAARRGRGEVTVLLFSPELEPFRSWKNRPWFWAKLLNVPAEWLLSGNANRFGGHHIDSVFGAIIDSRQIRKLPVGWLLLLLIGYLAVIGPLDRYWLKKLNRQMLTWITFPVYVALFSGLIYVIGYRLRAGQTEWNEFHVVDVVPHGDRADLRGRIYGSAYSPVNATYEVASDQPFANLRGEQGFSGNQEVSKAAIEQRGNSFAAKLNVPVWTSQLYAGDWWRQATAPLNVTVTPNANGWDVKVENPQGKKIPQARLVVGGRVFDLGDLTKGKTVALNRGGGSSLRDFVVNQAGVLQNAVNQRQQQFGSDMAGRIEDAFGGATAASFIALNGDYAQQNNQQNQFNGSYQGNFVTAPGFDLSPQIRRGDAVVLAWLPDQTLVTPLNKFSPFHSKKDTLLRFVILQNSPVSASSPRPE